MTSSSSFISLQLSPPLFAEAVKLLVLKPRHLFLPSESLRCMVAEAGFPPTLPPLARGSETHLIEAFAE